MPRSQRRAPSWVRRGDSLLPLGQDAAGFPVVRSELTPWGGGEPARTQRRTGTVRVDPAVGAQTALVRYRWDDEVRAGVVLSGRVGDNVFRVIWGDDSKPTTTILGPGSYEFPCTRIEVIADSTLAAPGNPYDASAHVARM